MRGGHATYRSRRPRRADSRRRRHHPQPDRSPRCGFAFTDIAARAGLTARTVYGGERANRYLVETTGSGAARLRLRRRRVDRHLPGQRLDPGGLSARHGADQPPVSQPARRHLRGRDGGGGAGAGRLGPGRLCGRLRQRRRRGPGGHVLGPQPVDAQSRRRDVRGRDAGGGARDRAAALGHGLRLPGLRPRRPARSLRRQLHRLRRGHRAGSRIGPVPLQGPGRRVRAARA